MPAASSPKVLGIDDFALRRRRHYGTVVVDVIASEIVDLLPDRTAASVSTWLAQHQAPEFICRDRTGEYASGARQGAPGAVQVADRFHLAWCAASGA
jgi:transposase